MITSQAEAITPALAEEYLALADDRHRGIRKHTVSKYARAMKENRWGPNNDAICFSPQGKLLNGRHRLYGVVEAGVTVRMMVSRGIPAEAFGTMDQGRLRSIGQVLHYDGTGSNNEGAMARAVLTCLLASRENKAYMTAQQQIDPVAIQEFVRENEEEVRYCTRIAKQFTPGTVARPTILAAVYYLCRQANQVLADEMFERLVNKDLRGRGDPLCAFYGYLERRELKGAPADHIIYVGFHCFSDLEHGRQRTTYKQPQNKIEIKLPRPSAVRHRALHTVA